MAVGWVLESIDSGRGVARWDVSVAQWGPDHATTAAAGFMRAVTHLGGTSVLFVALSAVGVVDWRRRRSATSLWFLLTVGLGITLVNNGLKLLIMRERPPVEHLVGSAGSCFPSGHAAASTACWMAVALVVGRWFPRRVRPWFSVVAGVYGGRLQRFGEPFEEVADMDGDLEFEVSTQGSGGHHGQ